MALAQHRIPLHGDTPYAHEREAIAFIEDQLPNQNPFLAWELVELLDGSTGRLYEIDLLVLGYSALYLVEIKSGPGVCKGDSVDWSRDVPGEPSRYLECPYRLANTKAKVLASLLQRRMRERTPWVQPLIFLSDKEADPSGLRADGLTAVVTRTTLKRALTHHEFPNRDPHWRGEPIRDPVIRDLTRAIEESGVRPRKGRMFVGSCGRREEDPRAEEEQDPRRGGDAVIATTVPIDMPPAIQPARPAPLPAKALGVRRGPRLT